MVIIMFIFLRSVSGLPVGFALVLPVIEFFTCPTSKSSKGIIYSFQTICLFSFTLQSLSSGVISTLLNYVFLKMSCEL